MVSAKRDNLERLAAARGELGARIRGIDAEHLLIDRTNPDDLAGGANWTLVTDAGWVDLMAGPSGAIPYPQMRSLGRPAAFFTQSRQPVAG